MIQTLAPRAPTTTSPLALQAAPASVAAKKAVLSRTQSAAAPTTAPAPLDDNARKRREAAKTQAHDRVRQLVERMKTLKQFASENPQLMAKQLAQIAKELKAAVKAYVDAGGSARGLGASGSAASVPSPAASKAETSPDAPKTDEATAEAAPGDDTSIETPTADAAPTGGTASADEAAVSSVPASTLPPTDVRQGDLYRKMIDSLGSSEAIGDMAFIKDVKGFAKAIRKLMDTARIQTAIKGPDDETREAFKDTATELKEMEKLLDGLDRDARASSPAAGMFLGLYA